MEAVIPAQTKIYPQSNIEALRTTVIPSCVGTLPGHPACMLKALLFSGN